MNENGSQTPHGISCDRCGKSLLVDEEVRYRVKLEIVAAYDTLEITRADLERDLDGEIREALDAIGSRDAASLERDVHWRAEFDVCPACQKAITLDPLGRP
jgi:hypothetical protein